jgi:hypothetical protein
MKWVRVLAGDRKKVRWEKNTGSLGKDLDKTKLLTPTCPVITSLCLVFTLGRREMDGSGAKRMVNARLVFCTSEDPAHLGINLSSGTVNGGTASSPGWVSAPSNGGPAHTNQELLFECEHMFRLQEIYILSHEHMISSQIVVSVTAAQPHDFHRCEWQVLGFVRLHDNTERNYQARERRRVDITAPNICSGVKLTLFRCHVNEFNLHNQVGLLSVIFSGNRCGIGAPGLDAPVQAGGLTSLRRKKTKDILRYLVKADPRINICRFFDLVAQCPEKALANDGKAKEDKSSLCFDKASVFTVWRPTRYFCAHA